MLKSRRFRVLFLNAFAWAGVLFLIGLFCGKWTGQAIGKGHEAGHGGILNVIGEEVGHVEMRIFNGVADLWFVGGGNDTDRSVPIDADEVRLVIQKEVIFKASPLALAGESKGNCSHFVAQAEWLDDIQPFSASGKVIFKGSEFDLIVHYPEGYDPHHQHLPAERRHQD